MSQNVQIQVEINNLTSNQEQKNDNDQTANNLKQTKIQLLSSMVNYDESQNWMLQDKLIKDNAIENVYSDDIDLNKETEYSSYEMNIDGVNQRRALFSSTQQFHPNQETDRIEQNSSKVETEIPSDQAKSKVILTENQLIPNCLFDNDEVILNSYLSNGNESKFKIPSSLNLKVDQSILQNKKSQKTISQAELSYVVNQADKNLQVFNPQDRLKFMSFMIQSQAIDSMSEDALSCQQRISFQTQYDQNTLNLNNNYNIGNNNNRNLGNNNICASPYLNNNINFTSALNYQNISKGKKSHSIFSKKERGRRLTTMHQQIDKINLNEDVQKSKNHFIILTLIQKFVKSCILKIAYKDFNLLNSKHFKIIGDNSYIYKKIPNTQSQMQKYSRSENQVDNILIRRNSLLASAFQPLRLNFLEQSLLRLKKNFIDCKFFASLFNNQIIQPNSLLVIIWDLIIILIMLTHLIILPTQVCFSLDMKDSTSQAILFTTPLISFTIDMIITFNTGIYELGVIVTDRKLISRSYWKKKFLNHLFLISILIINKEYQNIIFELFAIYFRLNQTLQRMNKINQHFQLTFKFPKFSELLKLITLILFVAHLCGCGFYYVGEKSYQDLKQDMSWIVFQKIEKESWEIKYVFSIYFAIVTMITIGYGDVYPTNIYERIYVIFMTFFSCGIFAYCINTIGNIFLEQNFKQKAFQQKIFDLQKYLESKSIQKDTQVRAFKYLEYLNEQTDEVLTKGGQYQNQFFMILKLIIFVLKIIGQAILNECPQELREEILKDYYGKILLNLTILQNNFSSDFIQALSIKMQEKRFGPGEVIIQQGSRLKFLYFLSKGEIQYFIQNGSKTKQILTLQVNLFILSSHIYEQFFYFKMFQNIFKVFDFSLFVTEKVCPFSIRSTFNTTMAYFTYEDFISTLREYSPDYSKLLINEKIGEILYDKRLVLIQRQI